MPFGLLHYYKLIIELSNDKKAGSVAYLWLVICSFTLLIVLVSSEMF